MLVLVLATLVTVLGMSVMRRMVSRRVDRSHLVLDLFFSSDRKVKVPLQRQFHPVLARGLSSATFFNSVIARTKHSIAGRKWRSTDRSFG